MLQHGLLLQSLFAPLPALQCRNASNVSGCVFLQHLSVTLINNLVHYTKGQAAPEASAEAAVEASGDPSAEATAHFTDIGLPKIPKNGLQPMILKAVWLSVNDRVAYQYFGQHAAALCVAWFVQYSESARSPDLSTNAYSLDPDEVVPDLEPYFQICGELLSSCLSVQCSSSRLDKVCTQCIMNRSSSGDNDMIDPNYGHSHNSDNKSN